MKEMVFIIQAYEAEMANQQLLNACTLELFATSEDEAMTRAKKLIKKKFYRTARIIEKDATN